VAANKFGNSWKTKSFLSSAPPADDDLPNFDQSQLNKRTFECSDSEVDENDDYASFRGKKQSKKKARIEANRARNVSPSGSEVICYRMSPATVRRLYESCVPEGCDSVPSRPSRLCVIVLCG